MQDYDNNVIGSGFRCKPESHNYGRGRIYFGPGSRKNL